MTKAAIKRYENRLGECEKTIYEAMGAVNKAIDFGKQFEAVSARIRDAQDDLRSAVGCLWGALELAAISAQSELDKEPRE